MSLLLLLALVFLLVAFVAAFTLFNDPSRVDEEETAAVERELGYR